MVIMAREIGQESLRNNLASPSTSVRREFVSGSVLSVCRGM